LASNSCLSRWRLISTVGRPAEARVESSGRRVTSEFISRSLGRTVSGRLRRHHPLPGGLAVERRNSPDKHKLAGLRQAAQPAHAADRLPRRVLRSLALALCLLAEYTCRYVCPANAVAVRLSCLACRGSWHNTPAADAPAVGRFLARTVTQHDTIRQRQDPKRQHLRPHSRSQVSRSKTHIKYIHDYCCPCYGGGGSCSIHIWFWQPF